MAGESRHPVLIALGSNLGPRLLHLGRAVQALARLEGCTVLGASPVFETAPVGGPGQGDYLNACVLVEYRRSPRELLAFLKEQERRQGRAAGERNAPRPIDLDILLFGDLVLDEPGLQIPHPAMGERAFALLPASSLAPGMVHPRAGLTVEELARAHAGSPMVNPRPVGGIPWTGAGAPGGGGMLLARSVRVLREVLTHVRKEGRSVGFVPTMGALHEGHGSLVDASVSENSLTVASIFVNPTQFGPGEDLGSYPRTPDADARLLESRGCGLLWMPDGDEMYPEGFRTRVAMDGLTGVLCGKSRPAHFGGVLTVVLKLLNQVQPDAAYFGRKDYQQALVVERMVRDLDVPVRIRVCPIVREPDGLAMSSRNRYLSPAEREAAPLLRKALLAMDGRFRAGERGAAALIEEGLSVLSRSPLIRLDYLEIRDGRTLDEVAGQASPGDLAAVAANLGRARLIDNHILGEGD